MNRVALFRQAACALVVVGLVNIAVAARAQTAPLKASGTGQVILQIDPTTDNPVGLQVYATQGTSTLLGDVPGAGITQFRLDGSVQGSFVATASDGSTIIGIYTGSFMQVDPTTFVFMVDTNWGGGTGRLAGVTAQSTAIAVLDALTGAFDWEHLGDSYLP